MTIIKNYLHKLNEGKDCKDSSLPNPYDYQSLKLDPNVTKSDLKIIGKWLKKHKKFREPKSSSHPVIWLYFDHINDYRKSYGHTNPYKIIKLSKKKPYIIVDGNKRVGAVEMSWSGIVWISWVPGHNYATRGTMKLIEQQLKRDKDLERRIKQGIVDTLIYEKNIPSLKVAQKLKMKMEYCSFASDYSGTIKYPVWWIKK